MVQEGAKLCADNQCDLCKFGGKVCCMSLKGGKIIGIKLRALDIKKFSLFIRGT